jgi:hypothetical protein
MNDWIKWCICGRMLLTTGQIEKKEKCGLCQKEHAAGLKDRCNLNPDNKEEKDGKI